MDKLKTCPFCGGEAETLMKDFVRCSNNECFMWGRNPVKAWNTRSEGDILFPTVKRLEAKGLHFEVKKDVLYVYAVNTRKGNKV